MLAFLDAHELAEPRRLRDLAFSDGFECGAQRREHFMGHMRVAAEQPCAGSARVNVTAVSEVSGFEDHSRHDHRLVVGREPAMHRQQAFEVESRD